VKLKPIGLLIAGACLIAACATIKVESSTGTEQPLATEAVLASTPEADKCLACHTDKQRLIDTAKPVEIAEAESKGVG